MRHPGPNLHKSEYVVRAVALATVQRLVRCYHRQGGGSNTATFRHGLFRKGHELFEAHCLGVAWWIPPTRGAAEASYEGDWRKVLALSRLVCVPAAPRNAASFLLARSIQLIRQDLRWECLITYASERLGHTGQIYKATNWEYLGLTKPEPVYLDLQGHEVARKAGPHTKTRAEMGSQGYTLVGSFRKHKFRLLLREE